MSRPQTPLEVPGEKTPQFGARGSGIYTQTNPSAISVHSVQSRNSGALVYNDDFRCRTMVGYLGSRICASGWAPLPSVSRLSPQECFGVLLRKSRGNYVSSENVNPDLLAAVQRLNVGVAFTMRPDMLEGILDALAPGQKSLIMTDGSQLQVLSSLSSVGAATVKKFQYGCVLRQERLLLVWHDDLDQVLVHATRIEEKLLTLVWGKGGAVPMTLLAPVAVSRRLSEYPSEYSAPPSPTFEKPLPSQMMPGAVGHLENASEMQLDQDESVDGPESVARPIYFNSAIFTGLALCLAIFLIFGMTATQLVSDSLVDGNWVRLALLVTSPFLLVSGLFFFEVIFVIIFQLFGPTGHFKVNSRYYSPKKPSLRRAYQDGFEPPHITIQMPVYKEGLESVIKPTVQSLQVAISHYESHGGTASIFINDDGMRAGLSQEDQDERRNFYHDNNIGWVARPKDNCKETGFVRKGKFKKASNMNFALNLSVKAENYLQELVRERCRDNGEEEDMIDDVELDDLYKVALDRALADTPLAVAEGNIRMGDFVLIVDSDTRVPVDCLLFGAAEMFLSPEVAIVQHNTAVMQVTWDYFENGITYFTNLIYTAICFSIGSGEVAPFVGHNAFLRWATVQAVGRKEEKGYVAYWSESHVSEDFDMALRCQINGSIVRLANYHGDGFKEGVSLTYYDEITRWQKYAYGCSEMIFHPLLQWPTKGPMSPLIVKAMSSNMIMSSKIAILAYICSYFAIGAGLPLTILNYFLIGWWADYVDHFYLPSWQLLVSLIAVFNILSTISLAVIRYRNKEKTLLSAICENFKWWPFLFIFFGGISFHCSQALLSHLTGYNMTWGSTSKEKEDSNFFKEIPKIFKTYTSMYVIMTTLVGGMIYLGNFAPRGWEITDFTVVVPLSIQVGMHMLAPFFLNPSLMVFNY